MAYSKPDVIVTQEFTNLHVTPTLERLQAVIIGPSYKKIKDDDSGSIFKKLDYKYRNEAMEVSIPELPVNALLDSSSIRVKIANNSKEIELEKSSFKGNVEDRAVLGNIDDLSIEVSSDQAIEAEVGDVLHFTTAPFSGYYEIVSVSNDKKTFVIDAEKVIENTDAGYILEHASFEIISKGYVYDEENGKISISPLLNISGNIYMTGKALRRDHCDDIIMARASDLEDIFGKGEVNSENPLALGMQLALANIGGGEDAFVAGIMVESDDVLGYQKAFEVLEAKEVYAMVPLTNNLVVPQVLMAHVDAMSKPEEKHERVCLFSTPWMNRYIRAGQLMIQQEDGSYDFVKGQITTTGKPLDDNFKAISNTFPFDGEEHIVLNEANNKYRHIYAKVSNGSLSCSLTIGEGENAVVHTFDSTHSIVETTLEEGVSVVKFKSNVEDDEACIRIFMYDDSSMKNGTYEYHVIATDGVQEEILDDSMKALRIKVLDAEKEGSASLEEMPDDIQIKVKCKDMDYISMNSIMTDSFDTVIESVGATASVRNDRYLIVAIALKDNGTLKINRLVGGDMDPDVATFISSGVVGRDEVIIIDKNVVDATTYSGYKETRYRVAKAKKENEIIIDAAWNEETQSWDERLFPETVEQVYYRVESPVITNKRELAQMYADLSASFHDRRVTHIFAPYVGISEDNEEHQVPGYYFACAYAGATQGEDPQQGFTNKSFAGFTKVLMTNDYFTESQLNVIASGGTAIVTQENNGAMLSVRHQLTTNMDTLEFREYSITKIVDYCAKSARSSFRPYIGRYNVTDALIDILYKMASSIIEAWKNKGVVLENTSIRHITKSETNPDEVVACFDLSVPYPLNRITLTLVI